MDCVPYWDHGDTLTCETTAAVVGGRFVSISGARNASGNPKVAHTGAGAAVFGVASRDTASGANVMVHHARSIITPVEAAAALTAGQKVMSDASGRAIVWTSTNAVAGVAVDDIASGAFGPIDRSVTG
jgi:hypothetical protein